MLFVYILIFISGICFGSFYNVVGMRMLVDKSIIKPPSHCPKCKHILTWYELVPIVSYMFLKGKCRKCRTKISIIYPLIELLTGLLFIFSFIKFGFTIEFLVSIVISSVLIIIFITDFLEYIILDQVLIAGIVAIFTLDIINHGIKASSLALLSGLGLFAFMYLIKIFGDKAFKRESLGGGDIKLAFFMGQVLGFQLGILSLVVSSLLAFPYAVIIGITKKDAEVPFGPFLITAVLIIYFKYDFFIEVLNLFL